MIIQIMSASKWRGIATADEFIDIVAFGLTDDGRVVALVVAEDGKTVEEAKSDFNLLGPLLFARLERNANLRKHGLLPPVNAK
jgi:hypothetical protein